MPFELVGVVGCGLMGSGIAEVMARAGCDVVVTEVNEDALAAGRARVERSLGHAVERAKLDAAEADLVTGRLHFVNDLEPFADRQLVVEAVIEDEDAKLEVFRALDG